MLLIGMISFTSCDSETELKQESTQRTFELVEVQDQEIISDVISVAEDNLNNTECSTCKVDCKVRRRVSGNSWVIGCNNGHSYFVYTCAGDWYVYQYNDNGYNPINPC